MTVSFPKIGGGSAGYSTGAGAEPASSAENTRAASPSPAQNEDGYEKVEWNGFSLGKIPLDREALRIELRRSYAGTDQEMMREMARRDEQAKGVTKQADAEKHQGAAEASLRRRDFSLVESIPDPTSSLKPSNALKAGGKKGKGDDDDLFGRAMDFSQAFNESGGKFKV